MLWEKDEEKNARFKKLKVVKKGKITVDSGAEASAWPVEMRPAEKLKKAKQKKRFVATNGMEMEHYGEKEIKFTCGHEDAGISSINSQASDVTKLLAAVGRIAEKGYIAQFGPEDAHCFIKSMQTGTKIPMQLDGGSYIMEVEHVVEWERGEEKWSSENKNATSFVWPEAVEEWADDQTDMNL